MGKRTLQTLCGASEVSSDQTLWKCLLAEFLGTAILGGCFRKCRRIKQKTDCETPKCLNTHIVYKECSVFDDNLVST
ncbi:aquaporin AQPcic-like [Tropilaelaps mercedesae]|uniref:Aquaporin AQPcic-like n=1 Tax=Tropilaelaps mercedesae TaxID=418985 RepID=A0A1V9XJQ7_9ACAR|nr:aquaporin AQPcic-like [Tropilaelaps mercedesae]